VRIEAARGSRVFLPHRADLLDDRLFAMRILVLADIHSNWSALAAVQEKFDACLFLGDLVDYATDPLPCIDWVRTRATAAIRGNHDHAVAQRIPAKPGSGLRGLAAATRGVHWRVLNPSRVKFLARLPLTRRIVLGDKSFYMVHGTPRDPLDEYLVNDAETWRARLEAIDADFVCVGHTHIQFHLDLGRTQLINPGSVGQPRDGDPRCAYAIIEDGQIQLRRIEYDIDATIRQMRSAGVDDAAVQIAEQVLRTGGRMEAEG
jgi:putative phosphoesterase